MTITYAVAVFVFAIVTGITISLTIREAIEHESMFRFFVWLMASILSIGVLLFSAEMACKDYDNALIECGERGYQSTEYDNGSWYCITFGNEPEIIKLEGVE